MTRNHRTQDTPDRRKSWYRATLLSLTTAAFVGAMVAGIFVLHGRAGAERSSRPIPPLVVNTARVELRSKYDVKERFVGLLEAARTTRLSFERHGQVAQILFDEGDFVSTGQVVAELDDERLRIQRRGLEARLQELEAQFELASVTLARHETLTRKGWQSHQKFDEARAKSAQLSAAIRHARASLDSLEIEIADSELRAPFSGTIAARVIDEGSVINAGTPVMDLVETGARRARVGVSVAAAVALNIGQNYQLHSQDRSFEGSLLAKRPDLQARTRTVVALFEVDGADDIPIGGIVELAVDRSIEDQGAWLPVSALTEGPRGLWTVLSVVGGSDVRSVARHAVEILHIEADRVYVRGNLLEQSRVVINGTNRVTPGQKVALATTVKQ